jgi:hypothetical protein
VLVANAVKRRCSAQQVLVATVAAVMQGGIKAFEMSITRVCDARLSSVMKDFGSGSWLASLGLLPRKEAAVRSLVDHGQLFPATQDIGR